MIPSTPSSLLSDAKQKMLWTDLYCSLTRLLVMSHTDGFCSCWLKSFGFWVLHPCSNCIHTTLLRKSFGDQVFYKLTLLLCLDCDIISEQLEKIFYSRTKDHARI